MSFCDDCIHESVCRFVKDIKEHECAPVKYLNGYTNGPTIKYAVNCPYKIVSKSNDEFFTN